MRPQAGALPGRAIRTAKPKKASPNMLQQRRKESWLFHLDAKNRRRFDISIF